MAKKNERQVMETEYPKAHYTLDGEELDKAMHDCFSIFWKAYRESVKSGNFKPYNECFRELYERYDDDNVMRFIQGLAFGSVGAANRRIQNGD